MYLEFGYSVPYGYGIFNGSIHIADECWPRDNVHIGKRIIPDYILDVTGVLRRTFPVEGILLDNGKQVCSVEVNAPGRATGAVGYHIFTRAINVW